MQILQCPPSADGGVPDYATRRKIEKQVTKSAHEHLIIFVDEAKSIQIWQWVAHSPVCSLGLSLPRRAAL